MAQSQHNGTTWVVETGQPADNLPRRALRALAHTAVSFLKVNARTDDHLRVVVPRDVKKGEVIEWHVEESRDSGDHWHLHMTEGRVP